MHRRVQLDNLRGMDPVTLEVTITDALRRPMSQLAPETLADLVALADSEVAPKALRSELERFLDRVGREIADVPDGPAWSALLDELGTVPAERMPAWLRDRVHEEAHREGRVPRTAEATEEATAHWATTEPVPFALGSRGAKVERSTRAARPRVAGSISGRRAIGKAGDKPPRAGGGSGGGGQRRIKAPRATVDEATLDLLIQTCTERLSSYGENGLGEQVLMVGIRKQLEDRVPDIQGRDVLKALEMMQERGLARRSAGRWKLERRWGG